jgi:hypothetical protein
MTGNDGDDVKNGRRVRSSKWLPLVGRNVLMYIRRIYIKENPA